jgi:hypothetical protein
MGLAINPITGKLDLTGSGSGGSSGPPINFGNGSSLVAGDPDYGSNAGGGIEQVCSIDYRQRWEGGRLWFYDQGDINGDPMGVREVRMNFGAPTVNDDDRDSLRFRVGSRWVHEDGRTWVCSDATEGAAVWNLVANVITPRVYYVTTSGSDTDGDGSLSNPYLTAQKAYDIGHQMGNYFAINLGVGVFTITNANSTAFLAVQGQGFSLENPTVLSLTRLDIYNNGGPGNNSNGDNAPDKTLKADNLLLQYFGSGGSVTTSDEIGNYTGGNGGNITLFGNALWVVWALGGSAVQNANGEAGVGGNPGAVTIKGGFLCELNCYNGEGYNSGLPIPSSVGGVASLDGVDGSLSVTPPIYPVLNLARSSLPGAWTVTNNLGGNATY